MESQIRINFSMVLNLLLSHTPAMVEQMLNRSFAAHRIGGSRPRTRAPAGPSRLWCDFLRHLEFLRRNGYVNDRDELTADGQWASQLRVDQPLLIAEGFRAGVFPRSDPALLAAIVAVFVNEKETDEGLDRKRLPKVLIQRYQRMAAALMPFIGQMRAAGFEDRALALKPAAVMYAWAGGQSWETVVAAAEMEEGDLAMLILRTADNLRHIRGLDRIFPQAAASAARAIERILREPVMEE